MPYTSYWAAPSLVLVAASLVSDLDPQDTYKPNTRGSHMWIAWWLLPGGPSGAQAVAELGLQLEPS